MGMGGSGGWGERMRRGKRGKEHGEHMCEEVMRRGDGERRREEEGCRCATEA